METVPAVRKLEDMVEHIPMPGHPNMYTLRFHVLPDFSGQEMTEEDWDKFEKDIEDVFEQVP